MEKGEKLYEGRTKIIYSTAEAGRCLLFFKDDISTRAGKKHATIRNKGIYNAKISATLFALLAAAGIPTHFVATAGERELLVKKLKVFPLEFVVRNVVAGSLARRLGIKEGFQLIEPVVEYYYKRDGLGKPLLSESHLRVLGIVEEDQLQTCTILARQANLILRNYFARRGLLLVDTFFEFGMDGSGIFLCDEISPDTCRLWDSRTGERLDKDRFRRDLGGVEEAYREVVARLLGRDTLF
ncbi:MAG TPA: phosphoribosylaminoimidazolesuccinocarboxamide synthase [Firmicutes bacterium]|nr:phosphoribosylaminoimidazolesuccinocarboxamide synthase [Bacillota bacterium]